MTLAKPIYAANELLMYVISKLEANNQNDIEYEMKQFLMRNLCCESNTAPSWSAALPDGRKVKNVDNILDSIRIINVAYPDKDTLPVVFVAVRTSNLPFVCANMFPSRESFVENRLAALELQMVEVLQNPLCH